MSKPRSFLVPFLVILGVAVSIITYIFCMPTLREMIGLRTSTSSENLHNMNLVLITIELPETTAPDGQVLAGYGFSIIIQEGLSIQDISLDKADIHAYQINSSKIVMISNPDNPSVLRFKDTVQQQGCIEYVNAYAGYPLETEYDYRTETAQASFQKISWFDNDKNKGLACLLQLKSVMAAPNAEELVEYQGKSIRGFLSGTESGEIRLIQVDLFRNHDFDRLYQIVFKGFSKQEVLETLATIVFDDETSQ